MLRLGILGSTRGRNLAYLMEAIKQRRLQATIEIVISNKPDALILTRANSYGVKAAFVDPHGLTREQYDAELTKKFSAVDLIVLIGYMRILSAVFVTEWHHKIINVHPSLLPDFAGGMDLAVHRAVLAAGVKETGCTVHFVTEEVDAGPIVVQQRCPVLSGDTPESLKQRVQALEGEALVEAVNKIAGSQRRADKYDLTK
ncbi:MAG: phosphoribosylglycinamide formyltransferase [Gammaproteobacteria bacterium RIFCSPHIGHO2_12_FULL_45_9]|nr:MAG: phosphoribosylglycinamide formyltransferase [Gammaproteobacteria bacterium RIFCSPHIGHO2_12_FULL_45_9]